jgi:serine protease inhibitor
VFLDLFFMYINVSCILVFHNIGSSVEVVPKFDVHFKHCIKDNLYSSGFVGHFGFQPFESISNVCLTILY